MDLSFEIEIKLTSTPTVKHTDVLDRFKALAGKDASDTALLICTVDREKDLPGGNVAVPWTKFPAGVREII
ncbi:MAG: hypothetical protein JW821_03345 [Deltaproteobacteria bacterium]|nr:hypothetical protein [Deltaproteobacteria bacterium]